MRTIFLILLAFILSGCSTSAYITGYNLVASKEKEIGLGLGTEESSTVDTLLSIETANDAGPLMVVTIPTGVALSPLFFIIGNISGAIDTIPSLLTPIEDRPDEERRKLAYISSSESTLEILAKDPDRPVRQAVAGNPNSSPKILEMLAEDKDSIVRIAVAENPKASEAILVQLMQDEDTEVRLAVQNNPNAPEKQEEPEKKETEDDWWGEIPYWERMNDFLNEEEE